MCFKTDAFTHTMTSDMRKRECERKRGEMGQKRIVERDEHRGQRKRIVEWRVRLNYIAGRNR